MSSSKKGGIDLLINEMREYTRPLKEIWAKELRQQGGKPHGPRSRQTGESMSSHIFRRERWWDRLKNLDENIQISEGIRADMLIESSGLDRDRWLMVLTSCTNSSMFEVVAGALRKQHLNIHDQERGGGRGGAAAGDRDRGYRHAPTSPSRG